MEERKPNLYRLDFLIALYFFALIGAELMGSKTFPIINIGGYMLNGSTGMFLIPIVFSVNDMIHEVYGLERIRNLAKISVFIVLLLVLFAAFFVALPPSTRFQSTNSAYNSIFSQSIRISVSSLTALAISNLSDVYIFSKLKQKLSKYGLWFRNNLSNVLAIFLDTVIFMTLAFYATEQSFGSNVSFLWGIILPYWALKILVSALGTPLVYAGVKWLRR
jgi:uncharacterized integral membrane protein (TIGR00697 family)